MNADHSVGVTFLRWTAFLKIKMNTGSIAEGWIAVMCALLPILIIAWTIYYVANAIHPLLGWLWDVLIVYACMGFRQFSRYYTQIAKKLQEGNDDIARTELALWLGRSLDVVSPSQIVALTIAKGSWSGLRHVFGVLIWFVLLPGPLGALLYQLTHLMVDAWSQTPSTQFDKAAHRVRYVLDWVAIRLTAVTFAIAGNFEDTLHAWRTCPVTNSHRHANQRALYLAATGGAIGVKIPAELGGWRNHRSWWRSVTRSA